MTTFLDLVRVYSTAPTNATFLEHLESQEGGGGGTTNIISGKRQIDLVSRRSISIHKDTRTHSIIKEGDRELYNSREPYELIGINNKVTDLFE